VWGSGCIDLHFLDLVTSWEWVVSFTPRLLYRREKRPRYSLDRRLGDLNDVEKRKIFSIPVLELRPPGRADHSQSLYRLRYPGFRKMLLSSIIIFACWATISFVGSEVFTETVIENSVFCDITPCSLLKVNRRFGGTCRLYLLQSYRLAACFMLVSCSAYSSTLKMEATCSSETSVDFRRTTRRPLVL
jgi:hypothetical protein